MTLTDPSPTGRSARPRRPGLRDQVKRTFAAFRSMLDAHLELARTEFEPILANVKIAAAEFALVFALALFVAVLVPIGTTLFLGEWLWGSMGWGIVHGTALAVGVAVAAIVLFLDPDPGPILRALFVAVLVGVLASVVLALELTNQAWAELARVMDLGVQEEFQVLAAAVAVSAIAGAVVGAIVGAWRGGPSSIVRGLVVGVLAGAVIGAFTAIAFGVQVGIALGVLFGLVTWSAFMGMALARRGVDEASFRARFYPEQTVETAKETMAYFGFRPDDAVAAAQQAADTVQAATETAGAAVADAAGAVADSAAAVADAAAAAGERVDRTTEGAEPRDEEGP